MDKQIQKLCDESLAAVAIDHPCIHRWKHFRNYEMYVCEYCDFELTEKAHEIFCKEELKS